MTRTLTALALVLALTGTAKAERYETLALIGFAATQCKSPVPEMALTWARSQTNIDDAKLKSAVNRIVDAGFKAGIGPSCRMIRDIAWKQIEE